MDFCNIPIASSFGLWHTGGRHTYSRTEKRGGPGMAKYKTLYREPEQAHLALIRGRNRTGIPEGAFPPFPWALSWDVENYYMITPLRLVTSRSQSWHMFGHRFTSYTFKLLISINSAVMIFQIILLMWVAISELPEVISFSPKNFQKTCSFCKCSV